MFALDGSMFDNISLDGSRLIQCGKLSVLKEYLRDNISLETMVIYSQ